MTNVMTAGAAIGLASLAAPAAAEVVEVTCQVERTFVETGRGSTSQPGGEWRFSIDTAAPSITWRGRPAQMNQPIAGDWLMRQPAPAGPTAGGGLAACLIDTGNCGQTIDTEYFRETVSSVEFSPGLRSVRMLVTSLFVDGQRTVETFSGPCTSASR